MVAYAGFMTAEQTDRWQCPDCQGWWPPANTTCPFCAWELRQHWPELLVRYPGSVGPWSTSQQEAAVTGGHSIYDYDPESGAVREPLQVEPVRPARRERPAGVCVHCGDEVQADRGGHLWTVDQNDGQPLWCDPSPDKRHALS